MKSHTVEYIVIIAYLGMMVGIGMLFRKFNRNVSDYFRSGSQGSWWLVGTSAFMSSISAVTFTGYGGAAFKAGWSVAAIYVGNIVGLLIQAGVLAPWFRQMRATTFPEVIRERFGPITQQFYAYTKVITFTMYASLWLYGLAAFCAGVFDLPVVKLIPGLGLIALIYPMLGGKWAVMAADFVKGLIMMSVTVFLSILCLVKLGGFSGMARLVGEKGLSADFAFVKPSGMFPSDLYTWEWLLAVFSISVVTNCGMSNAVKFFAVKTGREARMAALLSATLMSAGTILWFIPPMTARLLFEAQVMQSGFAKPEEASIAVVSAQLLPAGMLGMMVVAMLSATMSSMDVGINGNAAIFVKDLLPAVARLRRKALPSDAAQLKIAQFATLVFGAVIIVLAEVFAVRRSEGVLDLMLGVGGMIGVPITIPTILCLFIRRAPPWSAMFSCGLALLPSVWGFLHPESLNFQMRTLWAIAFGVTGFLFTLAFRPCLTSEYQQRVDAFLARMHRPVDFAKEVGEGSDHRQALFLGNLSLLAASFVLLLLFIPNEASGRLWIALLAAIIAVVGALLRFVAYRLERRLVYRPSPESRSDTGSVGSSHDV